MKRLAVFPSVAAISVSLLFLASACGGDGDQQAVVERSTVTPTPASVKPTPTPATSTPTPTPILEPLLRTNENYFGIKSELFEKADFAAVLAFAPDGRLFYNELRTGDMRIITPIEREGSRLPDGRLLEEPFAHVDVVGDVDDVGVIEGGLLGLAIDPEFESNHYVYIYFTAPAEGGGATPTIMRFTDVDNKGTDPKVILELPPTPTGAPFRVAGNIHFGPDGYLYVSVGDYANPEFAQDLSVPQGKILRINKEDGSAAPDNPFVDDPKADARIFAYGLRNSFDFTFHPATGQLYATENGERNCDELNLITKGNNYGWPLSEAPERAACGNPGATEAIYFFTGFASALPINQGSPAVPTGIEFVSEKTYFRLHNSLLVCAAINGSMRQLALEGASREVPVQIGVAANDCTLDIALDPNGFAYYSNEREIRRLVPKNVERP